MMNRAPHTPSLCIGVTGGIGSGKSTVCHLFLKLGVPNIDLDAINKSLLQPNTKSYTDIVHHFGSQILMPDRSIDTQTLKQIIFTHPSKKQALEAILHPAIQQIALAQIAEINAPIVLVQIPLLAEKGKPEYIDRVLLCDCSTTTQIQRVCQRDGISEALAQKIIQNQATRQQRQAIADDILHTDIPLNQLQWKVKQLKEQFDVLSNYRH